MIVVRIAIIDNTNGKIKKLLDSCRFSEETKAQDYINNLNFKKLIGKNRIDTRFRPVLIWKNTKTDEQTIEALD